MSDDRHEPAANAHEQIAVAVPDIEPGTRPAKFYIPARTSLQERLPRTLKHGDTFAVFDPNGDIVSGGGSPEGLYHRDTRHLSHLDLAIAGVRPMLLSSILRDDNAVLNCDLTNPDLFDGSRIVLARDIVHVRRSKLLWKDACHEGFAVRNFGHQRLRLRLDLRFAADFADLFEVRGTERTHRGSVHTPQVGESRVTLAYTGLDGVRRSTRLSFDPRPSKLAGEYAVFDIELPPLGRWVLHMEIDCDSEPQRRSARSAFMVAVRDARRALRRSTSRAARVRSSNDVFDEATRRSAADLYMLVTDTPSGPLPYAGIPWYSTAFGRDSLLTSWQTLWVDPEIARGTLRFLAENQARDFDDASDAEPGKILHETRSGEMAELGEVPFKRYYGSVDSTPLFVMLAGAYLEHTDDVDTCRALWPSIEAALGWIDRYGDRDGDGFVEYGRRTDKGLVNQGWKDSHDSIFHADGQLASGPIALCEVQGYVYAARRAAAAVAMRLGNPARAAVLENQAETLRQRFEQAFWCERLGTYAIALDGRKQPCEVRSSNAGHALFTGIASRERAARVVEQLLDRASFSGWGIRTIAAGEARYNPMSYHNGSVWPHDNSLIALGFARYGHVGAVARVFEGMFAASTYMDLRRLPELFCGFTRRRGQGPTGYPVACSPQAWAAGTPFALLRATLGMSVHPKERCLRFDRPQLPAFLDEVELIGVRVGRARVDISARRHGDVVVVSPAHRRDDVLVMTVT